MREEKRKEEGRDEQLDRRGVRNSEGEGRVGSVGLVNGEEILGAC